MENTIFSVLALAISSMIDETSTALNKNFHHLNLESPYLNTIITQPVDGAIDTITDSTLSLLRHYLSISDDKLLFEVSELISILECADDAPFRDTINAIALTYAAREFRTENNDDYYLVTVMRSYVNMLKTVCGYPINNADEFICIDCHRTIESLNLPFDFNWYLKPVEKKFFKVKFRNDFTFIFRHSDEYDFLCEICLMRSDWKTYGELLDSYTSSQMESYVEDFSKTLGVCDEYDIPITRFIDFLLEDADFRKFMKDHRFNRI